MTSEIMAAARDQILVLIDEQKELLNALRREEDLLRSQKEDGKDRLLTKERIDKAIEVLDGEADKASRLEITLAVAGTVKAGKSTVVNAIIGTEALPNRARPMTALPTVIRHEPDCFEPALRINNVPALRGLADRIGEKLRSDTVLKTVRSSYGIDMGPLIDDLANGRHLPFDREYKGRDRVFDTLAAVNDLLRLGRHDKIREELPIEEHDELHEMPALTVHFRCLVDADHDSGSLALLDLPGFNEAKSSHVLTKILEEQLTKASAVLVILDYTQINTKASAELEDLVDSVSGNMQDRIFVVVNKFDQRGARDPDENATKSVVSKDMLKGMVKHNHVYPVSAKHAYLASRALETLARNETLPLVNEQPWVADFGSLAFPPFDQAKLEEPHEAKRSAELLWAHSAFEPLLGNVIIAAQQRAGELAIKSALGQLQKYGEKIEKFLNATEKPLTVEIAKLKGTIDRMEESIRSAEKAKNDVDKRTSQVIENIGSKLQEILDDATAAIDIRVKEVFKTQTQSEAVAKASAKLKAQHGKGVGYRLSRFLYPFESKRRNNRESRSLMEELGRSGKLEYDSRKDCDEAWNKISKVYAEEAAHIVDIASTEIKDLVKKAQADLERDLDDGLSQVLEEAERALGDAGIEDGPLMQDLELSHDAQGRSPARLARNIETKLGEPYSKVTHRLANALDPFDIFGWGKKEVRDTKYVIDRGKAVRALQRGLEDTLGSYRQHAEAGIHDWRRHAEDKIANIGNYLGRYRQTLIDGLGNRSMEREQQERLLAAIRDYKKKSSDGRENREQFGRAAKRVFNA